MEKFSYSQPIREQLSYVFSPLSRHSLLQCQLEYVRSPFQDHALFHNRFIGHLRSLCVFAARLSNAPLLKPTIITFLAIDENTLFEKVKTEICKCQSFWPGRHAEIRIIDVAKSNDAFSKIWKQLTEGLPIESPKQECVFQPTVPPSLVILDGFQLPWVRTIHASTPSPPPILQWMMGFSGGYMRMVAPASMGGQGDLLRSLTPDAMLQLKIQDLQFTGESVQVPGMPATCDREQYPQAMEQEQFTKIIAAQCKLAAFIEEADGLVTTCAYDYDGEDCLEAMVGWIGKHRNRPTFHLGPMIPPTSNRHTLPSLISPQTEVTSLLDNIFTSHGPHSLLYISFGTQHFPSDTTRLTILLQNLIRRQIPFIFAHPTHAGLPSTLLNSLPPPAPSAPYLLTRWAPQLDILAHPACGWFLTHGGYNGTTEALMHGVPMIGWSFAVDQPMNVAYLARKMRVLWELPGAKTGYWQRKEHEALGMPVCNSWEDMVNKVLDEMVGEEGRKKRVNAEAVRDKLKMAWEGKGKAQREFDRFVKLYLD